MSDYPFFFTWSAQKSAAPVHLTGGEGSFFTTADGGRFLDLGSLVYQANAGHGNRRIVRAIKEQADRLCLAMPNAVYPEKIELARRLLEIAPAGFTKVFFTLGGAEANEHAMKIARMATGRYKVVSRYRSYHGATAGAASLTGDWRRLAAEPGLPGVVRVLEEWDDARLSRIPDVLRHEGNVGAVFVEPVGGHNGVLIPPPGYLARLREACDEHRALLVFDEVLTGFGRTGKWFAFERVGPGVVPDMITCGKAITAGYATLGAVLVHERVAKHFEENVLASGLTSYGHPLAVAAALESVRVYAEDGLVERAAALEPLLRAGLEEIAGRSPAVKGVRVIGLLAGIDLALDFAKLGAALRKRRLHANPNAKASVLVLSPPLCIQEEELAGGLALLAEAIEEASA
jgi:taurine--2-oxoglutarate transaminase